MIQYIYIYCDIYEKKIRKHVFKTYAGVISVSLENGFKTYIADIYEK